MYSRIETDRYKALVEKALKDYEADVYDICAGTSLISYASKGLLKPKGENRFIETILQEFVEKPYIAQKNGYLILRFARKNLLEYKN